MELALLYFNFLGPSIEFPFIEIWEKGVQTETLKPWKWNQVTGAHREHWQTPAMEVFHFANLLRKESKSKIYDLGHGLGRNLLFLNEQGFDMYGSDFSQDAVREVDQLLEQMGKSDRVKYHCMTKIEEEAHSFDAVLAYNVIYHSYRADLEHIIGKIYEILRPNGLFFSTFLVVPETPFTSEQAGPNTIVKRGGEEDGIPHHFITREELPRLLNGFELVQVWERVWEYENFTKRSRHMCVIARKKD